LKYIFFGLAVFCDFIDGILARKLKQKTKIGGILDPLVDKIFAIILFPYLFVVLGLPLYYLFFFFIRDIFTILGSIFVYVKRLKRIELKARPLGKLVTDMQFVVLLFMIIGNLFWIKISIYVLFFLSLASIVEYGIYFKKAKKI